jgi:transcription elongation factor Elf1
MIVLNALVKCPHCGEVNTVSVRLDDDSTEVNLAEPAPVQCGDCEKGFVTRAKVSVSFEVGVQKISWRKTANEKQKEA